MEKQTEKVLIPLWLHGEGLSGLLDDVRKAGIYLGPDRYYIAHNLLLRMVACGIPLEPDRVKGMLGSSLCTNPQDLRVFSNVFDNWFKHANQIAVQKVPSKPGDPSADLGSDSGKQNPPPFWKQKIYQDIFITTLHLIGTISIFLFGLSLALDRQNFLSKFIDEITASLRLCKDVAWCRYQLYVLLFFALFILISKPLRNKIVSLWYRFRVGRFLTRKGSHLPPDIHQKFIGNREEWEEGESKFSYISSSLRHYSRTPSREIDCDATVEATVYAGGWFTPVHKSVPRLPEYLILVERGGFQDQHSQYMDQWIQRLKDDGVFVSHYYFENNPAVCFKPGPSHAPVTLKHLMMRHPDHRLILFSNPEEMFHPLTGHILPWVQELESLPGRFVLSTRTLQNSPHERTLSRYVTLLPGGVQGLEALAHRLIHPNRKMTPEPSWPSPLPELFEASPQAWIGGYPAYGESVEGVIQSLQNYLGKKGFYWMAACAVYPEMNPHVTHFLGKRLKIGEETLFSHNRLVALVQLPWYRYGKMPDWLRTALLNRLSQKQEQAVRDLLGELILQAEADQTRGIPLSIAFPDPKTRFTWLVAALQHWVKEAPPTSYLQDHVFITFMSGGHLSFALSEPLLLRMQWLNRERFRSKWDSFQQNIRFLLSNIQQKVTHFLSVTYVIARFFSDKYLYIFFMEPYMGDLINGSQEEDNRKSLILFVADPFEGNFTWFPLLLVIRNDPELRKYFDLKLLINYKILLKLHATIMTPLFQMDTDFLKEELNGRYAQYKKVIFICHGIGGIVAKKYILDRLSNHESIERICALLCFSLPGRFDKDYTVRRRIFSLDVLRSRYLTRNLFDLIKLQDQWDFFKVDDLIKIEYIIGSRDRLAATSIHQKPLEERATIIDGMGYFGVMIPIARRNPVFQTVKKFLSDPFLWESSPVQEPEYEYDLFLSYDPQDKFEVRQLAERLKNDGLQVWFDEFVIEPGNSIPSAIKNGFEKSRVLAFALSHHSFSSERMRGRFEYDFVKGNQYSSFVYIRLDDCDIPGPLRKFQSIDYRHKNEIGYQQLLKYCNTQAASIRKRGAETNQEAQAEQNTQSDESWQKHILWVDDIPSNNLYERQSLESIGMHFTLAYTTNQALEILEKDKFNLVISDIGRAEGSREGYVLLDAMRKNGDKTPLIFYSGSRAPEHRRETIEHGGQGCTNNISELVELVTMHVK